MDSHRQVTEAPWTAEQVASLEAFQQCPHLHPLTCPNRDDHPVINGEKGLLEVTAAGLQCGYCDYVQNWVPDFILQRRAEEYRRLPQELFGRMKNGPL